LSSVIPQRRSREATTTTTIWSTSHDSLYRSRLQHNRFFSCNAPLFNVAAVEVEVGNNAAAAADLVDDPIIANAANPENFQPQQNILEEVTNSSDEAAIEVLEAAIEEVLQAEAAAPDLAEPMTELTDAITTEMPEVVAAMPVESPLDTSVEAGAVLDAPGVETIAAQNIADLPDPSVVDVALSVPAAAPEQVVSASVEATATASEPLNILSSATVDPSLIPLPPLPPIAMPTDIGDLPFAELGLNSWWPPGWVQWGLEYSHNVLGVPWWGSIIVTAAALRIVTIPLFVLSQRAVAQNSKVTPKFMELQMKYTEASASGDWQKKMRAQNDLAMFMKSSGYSPLGTMKPSLYQMPIFVSVFMALRGMVGVPVESMKSEGLFWFSNLTVSDPYYLLPLFNSVSLWLQMEFGVEMMSAQKLSGAQRWIMRALPIVMFPFICWQSSAVCLYWSISIWMAFALKSTLNIDAVRKLLNVPKVDTSGFLKISQAPGGEFTFKGFRKRIKTQYNKFKSNKLATSIEKKDETKWREAGLKGPVKTYKYDPTKVKF